MAQERTPSGIPAHHWLGLCARTESDRASEWPYIMWVIRGRVDSPRYPNTYEAVILQRSQFSAFNLYTRRAAPGTEIFDLVARKYPARQLLRCADLARQVILMANEGVCPPEFTADTLHYWSPDSMDPPGSSPPWAPSAKRLYTPAGLDPKRFVFAEGVP